MAEIIVGRDVEIATCPCGHRFVMPGDDAALFAHEIKEHDGEGTVVGWYRTPYVLVNAHVLYDKMSR